jgi:MOSC domain-containing protein YiiM
MTGRLVGIARAAELGAPLVEMDAASVTVEAGIDGDARGRKPGRQLTVLFREGWEDACAELGLALPWVTRRANLFVEGLERPRKAGGRLNIGGVTLEVTQETQPCHLMERAQAGLRRAMMPDWRGGVCCRVVSGGELRVGDAVALVT